MSVKTKRVSLQELYRAVSANRGISVDRLYADFRDDKFFMPRHYIIYLAKRLALRGHIRITECDGIITMGTTSTNPSFTPMGRLHKNMLRDPSARDVDVIAIRPSSDPLSHKPVMAAIPADTVEGAKVAPSFLISSGWVHGAPPPQPPQPVRADAVRATCEFTMQVPVAGKVIPLTLAQANETYQAIQVALKQAREMFA